MKTIPETHLEAIKQAWHLNGAELVWARPANGGKNVGDPVGFSTRKTGHRNVYLQINGKLRGFVYARVVWFLHTGQYPELEIDHIDCNPLNDHPANLRLATRSQNLHNTRFGRTRAKFKGTYQDKRSKKWHCQVQVAGKVHGQYGFETQEQAYAARQALATELHGAFAR